MPKFLKHLARFARIPASLRFALKFAWFASSPRCHPIFWKVDSQKEKGFFSKRESVRANRPTKSDSQHLPSYQALFRALFVFFSSEWQGISCKCFSVATPKNFFLVQTVGGDKLLEKCRWNIFKRPERGLKFSDTFRIVFRIFFGVFQTVFRVKLTVLGGNFVLQTCRPKHFGPWQINFQTAKQPLGNSLCTGWLASWHYNCWWFHAAAMHGRVSAMRTHDARILALHRIAIPHCEAPLLASSWASPVQNFHISEKTT